MGGVYIPDLVEAKSPLGLAVLARIACSVRVDWLCGRWVDDSAGIRTVIHRVCTSRLWIGNGTV
jgi:hypothetical protein